MSDDYYMGKRYVVEVESVYGFGRFRKYYMAIYREDTALAWGGGWHGNNPERLRRKGQRIIARLNRELDEHEAREIALDARGTK